MSSCCETDRGFAPQGTEQKRTLRKVLGINTVMFIMIVVSAFAGRSASLPAGSLDNLGDASTYALSLSNRK